MTVQIGREVTDRNFGVSQMTNRPTTQADTYTVNEDAVLTVAVANGVLQNDTSRTAAALTASVNTQPAHGSVTLNSNGSLTYTPTANYFGTDSFTYIASDVTNQSSPVAVTVTVTAQPDAPVAMADSLTVSNARTAQTINALANDKSVPDDVQTLTVTSVTQGTAGGTVTLNGGAVSYLAPVGFVGTDGMTMLIVTHEMGFAREVADRVIVMAEGELIEDSNPDDLFRAPKDPLTKALIVRYRSGEG